jgi:ABC-type nitrate/sulfonate/bicarbonate transport system substrate-binding protein
MVRRELVSNWTKNGHGVMERRGSMKTRSKKISRRKVDRLVALVLGTMLLIAACAPADEPDDADPDALADADLPTVVVLSGSIPPVQVAMEEGLYEGIEVVHNEVSTAEETALFIAGTSPIGQLGPWAVAQFVAEGENIRFLSTAGATNMINGVVVRAEDADRFQTIGDLEGATLGNPGFGSATWAAFRVMVGEVFGLDAEAAFENVVADPGALLGLLATGEIDAALLFSGQTATAMALDEFELIFSFTEAWVEETGHPLTVVSIVAKGDWADANPDQVRALIEGTDRGARWMAENPDEFRPGGKYEQLAEDQGWLRDENAMEAILELLAAGEWYVTSDLYTEEWIDATYRFIQGAEGILVDEVPSIDEIFYPPLD